jgi:hypothetical protein
MKQTTIIAPSALSSLQLHTQQDANINKINSIVKEHDMNIWQEKMM